MKVLSWDVGLRTLSYCLLENTRHSSLDTTDTSSGLEPEPSTPGETNAVTDPAQNFTFNILQWDSIDVQVDADAETSGTMSASGVVKPSKRSKVTAVSIEEGARLIIDTLHRRADFLAHGVDAIIIEQQPAGGHNQQANVRMKVMSHAIQCYFYTRGIMSHVFVAPQISFVPANSKFEEKPKTKRPAAAVVSASASATALIPPPNPETSGAGASMSEQEVVMAKSHPAHSQYSVNKKYAVVKAGELVRAFLPSNHKARRFFDATSTKKKDDLADSFLLGYYFLKKQHTARLAVNAKLNKTARKKKELEGNALKAAPKRKSRTDAKAVVADADAQTEPRSGSVGSAGSVGVDGSDGVVSTGPVADKEPVVPKRRRKLKMSTGTDEEATGNNNGGTTPSSRRVELEPEPETSAVGADATDVDTNVGTAAAPVKCTRLLSRSGSTRKPKTTSTDQIAVPSPNLATESSVDNSAFVAVLAPGITKPKTQRKRNSANLECSGGSSSACAVPVSNPNAGVVSIKNEEPSSCEVSGADADADADPNIGLAVATPFHSSAAAPSVTSRAPAATQKRKKAKRSQIVL